MNRIFPTLIFLLILNTPVLAAEPTAQQDFERGITHFKSKNLSSALFYFERAQKNGLDSSALHYNLGVTYYRLAKYPAAEKQFLLVSQNRKMAAVAYYNLGLVKLKQNDKQAAQQWFKKAYDVADNSQLKNLAARQLVIDKKPPATKWYNSAYAAIGYDSNVTLDNDAISLASNQSDSFLELFGYTRGILNGTSRDGLLLKARLFSDLYASLTEFNLTEVNAGLYKTYPLADWRTESGLYLTYSTQGGRGYLQSANLSFSGKKRLSATSRLRLRLRLHAIEAIDPIYDSLSGSGMDIRVQSRWRFEGQQRLRAYYQFDNNDRDDFQSTTQFISRSPLRHRVRVDYYFPLAKKWDAILAAEYRYSTFKNNNIDTTTGLDTQRVDDRFRAKFVAERDISKQLKLGLEYNYTKNVSSIETYEYSRHAIMAGLQYGF